MRNKHRRIEDSYTRTRARTVESVDPLCRLDAPGPFGMVIFGASGDLARRKLIPALYRLQGHGLMPQNFYVQGVSNARMTDAEFRQNMYESVKNSTGEDFNEDQWKDFQGRLYYQYGEAGRRDSFTDLAERIRQLEKKHKTGPNRMFYLAIPPAIFGDVARGLHGAGLTSEAEGGFSRVMVEKPFGRDIASARQLNNTLRECFHESQIFRLDHYLAKETVQNIIMFRFANLIFEPIWNNRFVDYVQITVAETLGVEQRAQYYEGAGVIRDMFQNHIFQLLALTAMEPPSEAVANLVRDEKAKVLNSVRPFDLSRLGQSVVLGQYAAGVIDGQEVVGYREEPGVARDSTTPTFAAMKLFIDNWRWEGVPFYLRSGKRLTKRKAEIAIHFKNVPHFMFSRELEGGILANTLILRLQPDEGINLLFQTKTQGSRLCLDPVMMDFTYAKGHSMSGYERVLLDCLQGDQMLFVREDAVLRSWEILTPVLEKLEADAAVKNLPAYNSGRECPTEALDMIHRDGRGWRRLV